MSNLLDKASILLTPTAYDNGSMLSVKPNENLYGSEQIVNGDFSENVNGWTVNNANATFVWQPNKTALFTSQSFAYAKVTPTLNLNASVYKVSFDILTFDGNLSNVHIGLGSSGNVVSKIGSYTYFYTSTGGSTEFQIRPNSGGTGSISIDNVSVVEDLSGDFTFTRGSAATRVNAQGLVENVQIISDELVSNGDFSQEGSELVTNGDFENGSTGWSISGSNLSIANGKATSTGSNFGAQLKQTILTTNKFYKITFDIVDYTSGAIGLTANYYGEQNVFSSIGTHTAYFTSLNQTELRLYSENFVGSIDNVSVKEVGQNWTFGTGWSMGDGKAIFDYDTSIQKIYTSNLVLNSSNTYKLSFEIKDILNGTPSIFISNSGGSVGYNGNYTEYYEGVHTFTFSPSSNQTSLAFFSRFSDFSITNISVKEITDDTDLPRIDYTDGCGSWLLEPQSTNLVTYSEDFSQWSKARATHTSEVGQSIIGEKSSVNKLTDSTDNNTHIVYLGSSISSGSFQYTYSAFLKKGSLDYGFLAWDNSDQTTCIFNLNLGTIHNQGLNVQDANIEDYGNGWYRCSVAFTQDLSGKLLRIGTSDGNRIYIGSGTDYIYFDATQLEQQSYATSYIPTNGSIATRLADVATNSGNSTLINSTEGVLYAEISALSDDTSTKVISLSDSSSSNKIELFYFNGTTIYINVFSNGVSQGLLGSLENIEDFNKIAFKYKENDFALWVNGTEVATDTSASTPIGLSELAFDNGTGGNKFIGKAKALAVYKEALTDAELQSLTTI